MFRDADLREQARELGVVIDMIAAMVDSLRDAFVQKRTDPLEKMEKRLEDVVQEIAFSAVKADEAMFGMPQKRRAPFLRYQSVLTHLKLVAETVASLAEEPALLIAERVHFSDRAAEEAGFLFERQGMILRDMAESARSADKELMKRLRRLCLELCRSCMRFSNEHESRMAHGNCLPRSAPLFLSIIDHMETLIRHERTTLRLMIRRL